MQQRIALVTGANRGIGREIAHQLSQAGLQVITSARQAGNAEILLDVARKDHIEAVAECFGDGLDVLVNNAGTSLEGFDAEVARRTLDVNFFGPMNITDALLPRLRPGARIVMVSSGMGELSHVGPSLRARLASPSLDRAALVELMQSFVSEVAAGRYQKSGWPSNAYSVSKVGLNALTRVLARELANDPRAILVNAACPGWVRTRMGGPSAPRTPEAGARTPVWLALLAEGGPTGGFFRDERPIPW
jgi:NAD(P)-dependent dehydrogenase (short-subunit alcohol dehydrogenase family)